MRIGKGATNSRQVAVTVLGCGTSTGVPVLTCRCAVCASPNPRNHRTRASVHVQGTNGTSLLIDASPDLRAQALREKITRLDAVLYTHAHADHILGTEDLRAFTFDLDAGLVCYGDAGTLSELARVFSYIFAPNPHHEGGKLANLQLSEIVHGISFSFNELTITPFLLYHGRLPVTGYRINDFVYATDCSVVPEESKDIVRNATSVVLDGLRFESHQTHFSIPQAIELARELEFGFTYLTHTTHTIEYEEVTRRLPAGTALAYDGLRFDVG